jgi:uncharacterized membrane protein YhaH (DUF805 family)
MMHTDYDMMSGSWMMMLFMGILVVVPIWRICVKAGYSGWLSLLVFIPIGNLFLLYFLGFAEWPLERKKSGSIPQNL